MAVLSTISVLWRLALAIDLAPQNFAACIDLFSRELQRVAGKASPR
jgi:hypothetical protein